MVAVIAVAALALIAAIGAVVVLDVRRSSHRRGTGLPALRHDEYDDRWSGADPSVQDDGPHGE